MDSVKNTLLGLTSEQKKEMTRIKEDYFFYKGAISEEDKNKLDKSLLGQSWIVNDDLDYVPTQLIDNKIEPLIKKQARFFLGKEPNLLFKARDKKDKEACENLRIFIDDILDDNKFWSETLKAFRIATVTKRVLLRVEANKKEPISLYYHDSSDFNYEVDMKGNLTKVVVVRFISKMDDDNLYNRYTYYLENDVCKFKIEQFKEKDLSNPISVETCDTIFTKIPCVLFLNESDLINTRGQSDITQLKELQNQLNRRVSDFSDALRFQMFGQTAIIDATEETVNKTKIAPNALMPLKSNDTNENGKQAQAKRVESSFSSAEPINMFLKRLEDSMSDKLSIPKPEQLLNIPSAKALKYIYYDLIARCYEKWNDWEPGIKLLISLIIEACDKLNCYDNYDKTWTKLDYLIVLEKKFPIPEDEEDNKRLAMEEVNNNVRSHRSYIKDFGSDDDYETSFNEVLEDIEKIQSVEQDQFRKDAEIEIDNIDEELNNESNNKNSNKNTNE
ncbi:TPA: phage portal protein [Clostridioides difficile]|nr:phage portal protein [Clostridioides difficile]MCL6884344.1 phage portal protein [Clostridioides difficile]MCP3310740.1 phage portal protein [Clostridioides difficile]MCZ1035081.1 phage portal protein [Clostridioides difficile]MCZ1113225.1 phage portal protein [Clostridioides difficile]